MSSRPRLDLIPMFCSSHRICHPSAFRYFSTFYFDLFNSTLFQTFLNTSTRSRAVCAADGRVVRWCWVNFQCRGVLQFGLEQGKGLLRLQWAWVGLFGLFTWLSCLSSFSPLWETARYRLKYCLKGPLNPKQPTNQLRSQGCHGQGKKVWKMFFFQVMEYR